MLTPAEQFLFLTAVALAIIAHSCSLFHHIFPPVFSQELEEAVSVIGVWNRLVERRVAVNLCGRRRSTTWSWRALALPRRCFSRSSRAGTAVVPSRLQGERVAWATAFWFRFVSS